jgi:hypothetical protein
MAKDVLVTEALSEQMISAGAKLVERLDTDGAQVKSAFWLFFPEERLWKLIIASPLVVSEGPRNFYKRIVVANQQAKAEEWVISLNDIGVTGTEHHIVQLLRFAVGTGAGIAGIRFSRNTINGYFIEDAYIYRSSI